MMLLLQSILCYGVSVGGIDVVLSVQFSSIGRAWRFTSVALAFFVEIFLKFIFKTFIALK